MSASASSRQWRSSAGVAHVVDVDRVLAPDGTSCIYSVTGELFFASEGEFIEAFKYASDPPRVIIDMSRAHVWDVSAVAALAAVERHYARHEIDVEITGLNSPVTNCTAPCRGNSPRTEAGDPQRVWARRAGRVANLGRSLSRDCESGRT